MSDVHAGQRTAARSADLFDLSGRVALVAGGAGGMGRAVVLGLAGRGADVAIADLAVERAEAVAAEVGGQTGRRSLALRVDLTGGQSVEAMVEHTLERLGALDVFVNMVGLNVFANLLDLTEADWGRMLGINLTGPFLSSRAAARAMADRGGGRIINFVSVTALRGSPGQAAYAAAKAGLINLTMSMALEWAPFGIRVNAISPVMTETAINTDWLAAEPGRKAAIARKIPAGRLGQPEDFVGPVVFLASDASRFMYGQTLFVDGGASVTHPLIGG
jgi:NAD(P)-dependent dehydrogenase (short-subunit alcohol dehydrogenase family)